MLERFRSMGMALAIVCGVAVAAPADDHQRGLEAYQRGDVVTAMAVLRAPAAAGYAPAQTLLANILDHADLAAEAFGLYRDAASQGDAEAHAALGSMYLTGRGVAKDEKQALMHFSKAADLGLELAIETVADAHLSGGLGAALVDPAQSAAVIRRAAEHGHLASVEALAQAYSTGRFGLAPDAQQAGIWQARAEAIRKQRAAATAGSRP